MAEMRLLDVVVSCDNASYGQPLSVAGVSAPVFIVAGVELGNILPLLVPRLLSASDVFVTTTSNGRPSVQLASRLSSQSLRSEALAKVLAEWRDDVRTVGVSDVCAPLLGWRDELYGVYGNGGELLFTIERSACGLFGLRSYGSHMTGYVETPDAGLQIWVARRSYSKQTYPGLLDNTVAGGITYGDTPHSCIIRECMEEAAIPNNLAEKVQPAGTISYLSINHLGICPEVQFVFDLALPSPSVFQPSSNDGEVHEFVLMSPNECLRKMKAGEFKPNCAVVLIDFLIRRGLLSSDNESDYQSILERIHRRLDFSTTGPDFSTGKNEW